MRSGIFGWSLPPGCGRLPGEEDPGPCACCGGDPEGDCICPECPTCGGTGYPQCYAEGGHGLTYTPEQLAGIQRVEDELRREAEVEEAYYKSASPCGKHTVGDCDCDLYGW